MKPKKSVLILSPYFRPGLGGLETHLDDLINWLVSHRYYVYVLTLQPPARAKDRGLPFEKKKNLEIYRYWWLQGFFYQVEPYPLLYFLYIVPWFLLVSFWFLLRKAEKIDVIHVQGANTAAAAKVLKIFFKKRIVVSTHATYSDKYSLEKKSWLRRLIKWSFSSADKILTLSQKSKKELVKIGLPPQKIEVYTYWVDQKVFKPLGSRREETRKRLGWAGKFIVLYVGRLDKIKGIRELLEAARITKKGIFYYLIGGGTLAKEVKDFAQKQKNTFYLGRLEKTQLPLYYAAADLVIVPSTHEEGFGRVILEALSCGTPVIGARRGAIPEALDESVGKLIRVSPENIRKAIEDFYDHPSRLEKMVKNARKYAEKRFSEKNAELIASSYDG